MSNSAGSTITPISNRLYPRFVYQRTPSALMPMPTIPERVFLPECGIHEVFDVRIAIDDAGEDAAFRVRHEVFCRDMGCKFPAVDGREYNETDQRSVQVVAYHRASGQPVGCYRLIMADPADPLAIFPIEDNCPALVSGSIPTSADARLGCAEISRFCVISSFRKFDAATESTPCGVPAAQWEAETHHRRGLAGLLWLTLAHLAVGLRLDYLVTLTEARLQQLGRTMGFSFLPIGEPVEYYGPRYPFRIDRRSLRAPLLVPQTAALLSPILSGFDAGLRAHPLLASYLSSRTARINRG
jgi:N-acyl amino acid synthase of PEP-CTERM/exosortase system